MTRATARKTPALQIVVQRQARDLREQMDKHHIAYEVLDQPGPLTLRIGTADWEAVRALAAERGYVRPDFFCQSDAIERDPFRLHWLRQKPAITP